VKPLVIDLFCGLGGWTRGFLAEGYDAIGFDIERHVCGDKRYPAQLVLQDVLTLHGRQFSDVAAIVASPPCQRYSYMAMPWSRAKREVRWQEWERDSPFGDRLQGLNQLFDACFRIQREASEAAGRHIPLVIENVQGAQRWVGPAQARFGSYFLWGDVANVGGRIVNPREIRFGAETIKASTRAQKFNPDGTAHGVGPWFAIADSKHRGADGLKVEGLNFHQYEQNGKGGSFQSAAVKAETAGNGSNYGGGFGWDGSAMRTGNSHSSARKAASALIAEIPFDLAQWTARCFKP
jgi:C-5 cytosine-specific DNA methylase